MDRCLDYTQIAPVGGKASHTLRAYRIKRANGFSRGLNLLT